MEWADMASGCEISLALLIGRHANSPRAAGIPAVISGAGPTVLALTTAATAADVAASADLGSRWFTASQLPVDTLGARVVGLDA